MKISVKKPAAGELKQLGVENWDIWECEPSTFDYHYDECETCYFLAGKVKVVAGDEQVEFCQGDLVVFPAGLDCTWYVLAKVRKHYKFG